jgi:hypothetical protein
VDPTPDKLIWDEAEDDRTNVSKTGIHTELLSVGFECVIFKKVIISWVMFYVGTSTSI